MVWRKLRHGGTQRTLGDLSSKPSEGESWGLERTFVDLRAYNNLAIQRVAGFPRRSSATIAWRDLGTPSSGLLKAVGSPCDDAPGLPASVDGSRPEFVSGTIRCPLDRKAALNTGVAE
jgi:hypothetical protein